MFFSATKGDSTPRLIRLNVHIVGYVNSLATFQFLRFMQGGSWVRSRGVTHIGYTTYLLLLYTR